MSGKRDKNSKSKKKASKSFVFSSLSFKDRRKLDELLSSLLRHCSNLDTSSNSDKLYSEFLVMNDLLSSIKKLQAYNMTRKLPTSRKARLSHFNDWINQNTDVYRDGVQIVELEPEYFGLQAVKDLSFGDVVLRIPRKLMMTSETAATSSLAPLIASDPLVSSMDNVALALHLLLEKNSPASFWEPYIDMLPSSYSTVLYFTPEDLLELKGSPAFEASLKTLKFIARQYAYLYGKFSQTLLFDYFTFEEYIWAVSTVMTRQNKIPSYNLKKDIMALIPFWDFGNHDSVSSTLLSSDFVDDSLLCKANQYFIQGEEFTIFYGIRSNFDFLLHNGFVPNFNPLKTLSLKLGVSRSDPLHSLKILHLTQRGLNSGVFSLKESEIENSLMDFLRINSMDKVSLSLLTSTTSNLDSSFDFPALSYLKTRCELLLKSYPTSLEEDEKCLEFATENQRHCIRLRREEKKILIANIFLVNQLKGV